MLLVQIIEYTLKKMLKSINIPLDDVLALLEIDEGNTSELLTESLLLGTSVNRNGG